MIVIPMAGLSQRFRKHGYTVPKYMLPLSGRSVFAHAVGSFTALFDKEPFLFIARAEADTEAFIAHEAQAMGIGEFTTVILPEPTKGQADTVVKGLQDAAISGDTSLTIFNIDTFRPDFQYPHGWFGQADGYLEVMLGDDPGFSFVAPVPGSDSQVLATAEKKVISNLACTGLYYFKRATDFIEVATEEPDESTRAADGEHYIAPLYNRLIKKGLDIRYEIVLEQSVIFCGIPAQYEALKQQEPQSEQLASPNE